MTHDITMTEAAATQISKWFNTHGSARFGARLAFERAGCAGYRAEIEPAEEYSLEDDEVVELNGAPLLVAKAALPFLEGTTVDFGSIKDHQGRDTLNKGFNLLIPKATEVCGCGSTYSFDETITVKAPKLSFGKG